MNPKFAEIFGYTVEQCLNDMPFHDLVHPDDIATVEEQIRKRLSGETKFVHYTFRGIAHDYNNALSVIIGFTELTIEDVGLNGPQRINLEEVLTAAKRAADITRKLLAFARRQTIAPKMIDLTLIGLTVPITQVLFPVSLCC